MFSDHSRNEETDTSTNGHNERLRHNAGEPLSETKEGKNEEEPAIHRSLAHIVDILCREYTPFQEYGGKGLAIGDNTAPMEAAQTHVC